MWHNQNIDRVAITAKDISKVILVLAPPNSHPTSARQNGTSGEYLTSLCGGDESDIAHHISMRRGYSALDLQGTGCLYIQPSGEPRNDQGPGHARLQVFEDVTSGVFCSKVSVRIRFVLEIHHSRE